METKNTMVTLEDIEIVVKPLDEMGEREVKHEKVIEILEELYKIQNELKF